MLYRKSSPRPPRLLLRIVATAGASALLGVTACGGAAGSVAIPPSDSGTDAQGNQGKPCGSAGFCGSVASPVPPDDSGAQPVGVAPFSPDSGSGPHGPCGGGPCGVMVMPHWDAGEAGAGDAADSGDASIVTTGIVINPDSGDGATGPCNGLPCGVIIHPEAGFD